MNLDGTYVPVRIAVYVPVIGFICNDGPEPHVQPNLRVTALGYMPVIVDDGNPLLPDYIKGGVRTPPVEVVSMLVGSPFARTICHN